MPNVLRIAELRHFPGHELAEAGLEDLAAGRESEAALLLSMAASRLRAAGLEVPESRSKHPGHRLYELISEQSDNAHSRYNALIGRMVSFARAVESASSG